MELKLKEMNRFVLRTVGDIEYFREHNGSPGFLYSLTTKWLKDDGTRPYEIEVTAYRMLQHGRKTSFGGGAA